jgi:Rrf2 family iron-sulfur cluster assembly transcriptional regulator
MKITSRGRYAVIAMLDIALTPKKGTVTLAMISERQEISLPYLEQIFSKLKKENLVISSRGPGGGYNLSRDAKNISIKDIVLAVDEEIDPKKCAGKQNCKKNGSCLSHHLWDDLSNNIEQFLSGVSLQTVIDKKTHQNEITF